MQTTRRGLVGLAFFVPAAALSGFAVVMARKIVKRGPKDYRRAELTDDGRRVRIDLDDYTKALGDFGVFDPVAESYTRVGEVTLIDEDQKYVERLIHPSGAGPARSADRGSVCRCWRRFESHTSSSAAGTGFDM